MATFFETPQAFRQWLEENHASEKELIVGFYKKGSGKPSMNWSESVDQALCFGWIDGLTKTIDAESYSIRFTPRRTGSIWSNVNIQKVEALKKNGLMRPEGLAAFEKRSEAKSGIYSFENEPMELSAEFEKGFKENTNAWNFFSSQPDGYKKLNIFRIMSAKQEKTQWSRLEKLIAASEEGKRLD